MSRVSTDGQQKLALKELFDANSGKVTPRQVVDAASDPSSPLHGLFEWDDSKAAKKYRLTQAREVIASVSYSLEVKGETIETRHYESVRINDEPVFVSVEDIAKEEYFLAIWEKEQIAMIDSLSRKMKTVNALRGKLLESSGKHKGLSAELKDRREKLAEDGEPPKRIAEVLGLDEKETLVWYRARDAKKKKALQEV